MDTRFFAEMAYRCLKKFGQWSTRERRLRANPLPSIELRRLSNCRRCFALHNLFPSTHSGLYFLLKKRNTHADPTNEDTHASAPHPREYLKKLRLDELIPNFYARVPEARLATGRE